MPSCLHLLPQSILFGSSIDPPVDDGFSDDHVSVECFLGDDSSVEHFSDGYFPGGYIPDGYIPDGYFPPEGALVMHPGRVSGRARSLNASETDSGRFESYYGKRPGGGGGLAFLDRSQNGVDATSNLNPFERATSRQLRSLQLQSHESKRIWKR